MARHELTRRERLTGIERALASDMCPARLKPGLRCYAQKLRRQINARAGAKGGRAKRRG
jgi:hypothetical protein